MKVYHVFNFVDFVGTFHCRSFSSKELAETFVILNLDEYPELYVSEELLDNMELLK